MQTRNPAGNAHTTNTPWPKQATDMTIFPCAKINLGLNVVERREDGYHDIETVFYPIPLHDALEIKTMDSEFPSPVPCDLKTTGDGVDCKESDNLVVKAYNLLAADYVLPRVHAHLAKTIPSQAGLGGGSSDAAYMIRILDERYRLNIGNREMERYAAQLGADCPFFITAEPSYATGIGTELAPVCSSELDLSGFTLAVVKPDIAVSTRDAYKAIKPKHPAKCCRDIVCQPIETWKDELTNDFETPVFAQHPRLAGIKDCLYAQGALYAQMSGSGSALYGIFRECPANIEEVFPKEKVYTMPL